MAMTYYSSYRPVNTDKNGRLLEITIVDALQRAYDVDGEAGIIIDCTGTALDTEQGTDFTVYGVPCDLTLNFEGKDNMLPLPFETPLCEGWLLRFGIRFGNNHNGFTEFEKPVLVIGIISPNGRRVRRDIDIICQAVFQNAKLIGTGCRDLYRLWSTGQMNALS